MELHCPAAPCTAESDVLVCRCLRVSRAVLTDAIDTLGLASLKEVRCHTGAGAGCMCCHGRIKQLLREAATRQAEPVD